MENAKGLAGELLRCQLSSDPLVNFDKWFENAKALGIPLPESCALATCDLQGHPSVRIILCKERLGKDFLFFTNYKSRKSQNLDANPKAAIVFHWPTLEQQIRIEGTVRRVDRQTSEKYFATRPRGSQLGAWASAQSEPLEAFHVLETNLEKASTMFANAEVPCPQDWGGFALSAESIEFWQGRPNRLHDRFSFSRTNSATWSLIRLSP